MIERVRRGWYTVAQPGSETSRHRHRARAARHTLESEVILSHTSAAAELELPLLHPAGDTVHLTLLGEGQLRSRHQVVIHSPPPGLRAAGGVVHPAFAVVGHGLVAGLESAIVAGDYAIRHQLTTPDELAAALAGYRGRRGVGALRELVSWLDPRAESAAESLARYRLTSLGYRLTPQHYVQAAGARVDFMIDGENVVIEIDGRVKYTDQKSLFAEKQREDRLRECGYEVVRLVWADLWHPARLRSKIDAAIARSRTRR